jgi:hypothetical protein
VGLVILHEQCHGFINVMCNRTRKISMYSGLVVHMWLTTITLYSGVTPKLAPCAIPEDSAHTAANFDTLPSAGKLLFIYEILDTQFMLC